MACTCTFLERQQLTERFERIGVSGIPYAIGTVIREHCVLILWRASGLLRTENITHHFGRDAEPNISTIPETAPPPRTPVAQIYLFYYSQ